MQQSPTVSWEESDKIKYIQEIYFNHNFCLFHKIFKLVNKVHWSVLIYSPLPAMRYEQNIWRFFFREAKEGKEWSKSEQHLSALSFMGCFGNNSNNSLYSAHTYLIFGSAEYKLGIRKNLVVKDKIKIILALTTESVRRYGSKDHKISQGRPPCQELLHPPFV